MRTALDTVIKVSSVSCKSVDVHIKSLSEYDTECGTYLGIVPYVLHVDQNYYLLIVTLIGFEKNQIFVDLPRYKLFYDCDCKISRCRDDH